MRFVLRQLLELVSEGPPRQAPLKRYRRFASAGACLGIGLTVLFLAAASARAQNEAGPNADLNQDFAGWSFVGDATWVGSDDADGCTGGAGFSGSVTVDSAPPQNPGDPSAAAAYPQECLQVFPGDTIHTEVTYKSEVDADVVGVYFDIPNCSGLQTDEPIAGNFPAAAVWTRVAETITVPEGAYSMFVAWAAADPNGLPFSTSWDRVYIGRRARVFSDDFEAASTCRWSAVSGLLE